MPFWTSEAPTSKPAVGSISYANASLMKYTMLRSETCLPYCSADIEPLIWDVSDVTAF